MTLLLSIRPSPKKRPPQRFVAVSLGTPSFLSSPSRRRFGSVPRGECLVLRHRRQVSRDIVYSSALGGVRCRWAGWWWRRSRWRGVPSRRWPGTTGSRGSGCTSSSGGSTPRVRPGWNHGPAAHAAVLAVPPLAWKTRSSISARPWPNKGSTPALTPSPSTWKSATAAPQLPPRSGESSPDGASSSPTPRSDPGHRSSGSRRISPTSGGRRTSRTGCSPRAPGWRSSTSSMITPASWWPRTPG